MQSLEDGFGGTTPTGYKSEEYKKVNVDGKSKKVYRLVFIKEERKVIELIYSKYLELKSQTKLETYLIQSNIKTKTGKDFSRFALKSILLNPVYAINDMEMYEYFKNNEIDIFANKEGFDGKQGVIAYNKTIQGKHKANKQRDMTEWIISIGKHQGFITGKDWVEVQHLMEANEEKRYRLPRTNKALLSGLIKCGKCGNYMRPKLLQNKDENGNQKFYYMCELKEKSRKGKCDVKNIYGNEVDKIVLEEIKKLTTPKSMIYQELQKLVKEDGNKQNKQEIEIEQLEASYNRNKQEKENLIDKLKYISDNTVIEDISNEIKKLNDANTEIEKKLQKINESKRSDITDKQTASLVLDILNNYFSVFEELDILKQREMVKLLISNIKTDGENLEIDLLRHKYFFF